MAALLALQAELNKVKDEEARLNEELALYFVARNTSQDLQPNVRKLEESTQWLDALRSDATKVATQVIDCRTLSDRLSIMVRRLDLMQIRAQQALACTEDVINLKECKAKMLTAIEEGNLPLAVSFIRQVHDIDEQAAKASDDYGAIQQAEREVRVLVQTEFGKAIEESNLNKVMSLCPLFQTLGLETDARDTFLAFVEKTVFTEVSADASSVDDATDPATGYAQALSNVFNSSYIILQRYLPMVIQGMEHSLGDVHFIRKLHAKCEKEAGSVLKRYMKYRQIKVTIGAMKSGGATAGSSATVGVGFGTGINSGGAILPSDIHVILDELALLVQYCCMYSKYLKQLTDGAEKRARNESAIAADAVSRSKNTSGGVGGGTSSGSVDENSRSKTICVAGVSPVTAVVFQGPTDFDKMVDELVNRYYMEGEHWLMKRGVKSALPALSTKGTTGDAEEGSGLDECFFVLQRCSQRAIATNNIHAACAVLHLISDLLSSDLLKQCCEMLSAAAVKASVVMQEHLARFRGGSGGSNESTSGSLSKGLKSAMSLVTGAGSSGGTAGGAGIGTGTGAAGTGVAGMAGTSDDLDDNGERDEDDVYGMAAVLDVFNTAEMCVRYTERLGRDVAKAGEAVFGATAAVSGTSTSPNNGARAAASKAGPSNNIVTSLSPELEKLKLCKEDFEATKHAFQSALKGGAEKVVGVAQGLMKDILVASLGRNGPLGGVKFDLDDEKFDAQPAVGLLPKLLVTPFEMLLSMCTSGLTEANKELMVGLLADACCERFEQYVTTSTFRFAGALKFEECVRVISATFNRFGSVRGKFSRLREVMLVLTSDTSAPGALLVNTFSHLTANEVLAFVSLRADQSPQA